MNAQTIQDSVNKYRYGVKIGNYNEETFGRDYLSKTVKAYEIYQNNWAVPNSTQKDSFKRENTILATRPAEAEPKSFQQVEFDNMVKKQSNEVQHHLLFGHGVNLNDVGNNIYQQFEKRQLATSYDLSYNKKLKTQTQISSRFEPN